MSITKKSLHGAKKVADLYTPHNWKTHNWSWRIALILGTIIFLCLLLMFWWSSEPERFDLEAARSAYLGENETPVVGSAVTGTTAKILDTLLHKPGGYLRNDVTPPGIFMDNIPEWEFGVIRNLRETIRTLRYDFSRSQSQSRSVKALEEADNDMNRDADKWITFPTPEASFSEAQEKIIAYGHEIADNNDANGQFYARADNLVSYLEQSSKSLGDLSQQLSASVGDTVIDRDTGNGEHSKATPAIRLERTPRLRIDNIFYLARGYSWALLHELEAIRIDFKGILEKKGALASLDQIINELEKAQNPVWSPIILNGRGFGFSANHSLVMGSYLSRANAGIIDLIRLLREG
ncbi:MAG: DUF2333 family protein [Cardiobacteriaceae bacterium]|nr:DUF2333 family protein [Cardiobacteriaceae bacterium]